MKKFTAILTAAFLAVTLAGCAESPAPVTETSETAFENHTIMPRVAEEDEETDIKPPAKEFDGEDYDDDEYIEKRENDEYEYEVYSNHIVLTGYIGNETAVEIPAEIDGLKVTEIGLMTFSEKNVTSVTIPNSVVKIGDFAFKGCKKLTEVSIPDSVVIIGGRSFAECESLEGLAIPESVTEIGENAFARCSALKEINLPSGIEKIGYWTFYACQSLTKIEIPDSVAEIEEFAFSDCINLVEISLPENVDISDNAFDNTAWIKNQPKPLIINDKLMLWDTVEGDIVIPDGVTRICGGAFFNCKKITSVTIPDSVKAIGGSAFQDCTSLKSVIIPNSVEVIENYAFARCEALEEIVIPESVTEIEEGAFLESRNLKSVTISDRFDDDELKEAFGDTYWYKKLCDDTYVEIRENDEYQYDVYEEHIIILQYWGVGEHLDIPAEIDGISVTEIGEDVFAFESITSVAIPNSITKIGEGAFKYTDLTEVTIPDSVTILGEGAFSDCEELADVTVPEHFDEETVKSAFEYTPWYEENYGE